MCQEQLLPIPILRFRNRFHRKIDWNRKSIQGIGKGIENRLGGQESIKSGIGSTLVKNQGSYHR